MTDSSDGPDEATPPPSSDEMLDYCATCGARLPEDVWCPVVSETDSEGSLVVRSFCDAACRDAWTDDETTADGT